MLMHRVPIAARDPTARHPTAEDSVLDAASWLAHTQRSGRHRGEPARKHADIGIVWRGMRRRFVRRRQLDPRASAIQQREQRQKPGMLR